ncbi:MAG: tyrosine-type recombinase/integrase [Candidatus Sulfotelmatobacter sp.]|jgi:site-specific recombinase XerD
MFNTLYRCPRTIARHENGPLAELRRRYLEHLAAQGAALHTLRGAAGIIYRAAIWMKLDESGPVERKEVERAAKRWSHRSYRNASCRCPQQTDKEFRQTTCNWLRFVGRLRESDRVPAPHQEEIDALCRYSEVERGLSPATIATVRQSVRKFLKYICVQRLSDLKIADVDRFLVQLGKQGWTRHGIRSMAHQLRLFFRYGEQMGWTKTGMAASIHGPRVYQHEQLPLGPSWPDVQRLLASTETNRKVDIRDRPILLLLAVYGLRVSEVQRLRLEDVNWEQKTLTITATKQRSARVCPLIPSLADAISRYIREVRPRTEHREIFLRMYAPRRPFRHGGLYGIVATRFERLGIKSPRTGPHSLRHACATHLLAQGLTLTEVGGHLGHRSADSTRIYAKVDMPALREVAELDLGGLL